ncbi:hypothetical protein [Kineosporia sp. R_H_3]|uniref:hypothetical protein n=1 Tax=Kineosporia sp. R_H_3 TaxID=1961848 RepID=UPI000B4B53F5|nr:hypothetical protein [Kineosporia sp. R_H_3]
MSGGPHGGVERRPVTAVRARPRPLRAARLRGAFVAALAVLLVGTVAAPAGAASWPATKPVDVSVLDVTHTSFRVTLARTLNADSYRLWISPKNDDMYVSKLRSASSTRKGYVSKTPAFALTGLTYRAAPYYVRVATAKGSNWRVGGTFKVWLRPWTPGVTATADGAGLRLTWQDLLVTGYEVRRATNAAFTTGLVSYTVRGRTKQFTPYGVAAGTPYWFQVRSVNGATRSAWSTPDTATPVTAAVKVRVASYNILGTFADGKRGDFGAGEVVAPWTSARRTATAATVRPWAPAVILVQEGSEWMNGWDSDLQVDTFAAALGSRYVVARTQGRAGDVDYARRGVHVVYDGAVLEAVGNGGNWTLPNTRFAAWQRLRHKATGAEMLVISVHNTSQAGATYDVRRRAEAEALSDRVAAYQSAHGPVPVVTGGDVGSYAARWHPYDPPGVVMRADGYVDTLEAAQYLTNQRYGSYNHYTRRPPKDTGSADRIFASPGVGVVGWAQLLRLKSDGTFNGTIPSDHNPVLTDVMVPYADGGP